MQANTFQISTGDQRTVVSLDTAPLVGSSQQPMDIHAFVNAIQPKACPGTEEYADCFYPSTPNDATKSAVTWTCAAGRFCVGPGSSEPCTPGFYCPTNAAQPIFCPRKYYCSEDTTSLRRCPAGYVCPIGTVKPVKCWLAICPAGTDKAENFYVMAIFFVFALIITYVFYQKRRSDRLRAVKHQREITKYQQDASQQQQQQLQHQQPLLSSEDALLSPPQLLPRRSSSAFSPESSAENIRLGYLSSATSSSQTLVDSQSASNIALNIEQPIMLATKPAKTFDIQFRNLSLTLPNGVTVVSDVSGEMKSGRTLALLGPSGSGKTTFLSILTGKTRRTSGIIQVNGVQEELSKYRKLIGFVPQDDVMLRELTVRDILMHSARMRLPRSWNYAKIKSKVMETIAFLGLTNIMNYTVGCEEARGISGGQRKRVNIGMEIVSEPSILFLDEPTSGLDSTMAVEICQMLKTIASTKGMLVAAVIHSPSHAAFKQFDDIMLLGKGGQCVYFGPREKILPYFEQCGFRCPPDESPSDFIMDIICGKVRSTLDPHFRPNRLGMYWTRYQQGQSPVPPNSNSRLTNAVVPLQQFNHPTLFSYPLKNNQIGPEVEQTEASRKPSRFCSRIFHYMFRSVYNQARDIYWWFADVFGELLDTIKSLVNLFICRSDPIRETPRWFVQFWLLFKRACMQVYRSLIVYLIEMTLHFGCGLFISVAVSNFDYLSRQPEPICQIAPVMLQQNCRLAIDTIRIVAMFLCLGVLFAGISVGSHTFGRERPVYWRDTSSGMPTTAYYLAKYLVDLSRVLPASLSFTLAFTVFYLVRMSFANLYVIILLLYLNAFPMGYFLSTFLKQEALALGGSVFAVMCSLVFSGVVPALIDIPDSIKIFWNISVTRWAVEAFWVQEVLNRPFTNDKPPENAPYSYQWDGFGMNCINMLISAAVWNGLAFLFLKLMHRSKMK